MGASPRRLLRSAGLLFLPLAVVATGLAGTVYIVAQQALRAGADSPQLQLAEDAARALDAGTDPAVVTGPATVDVAESLAPFIVVFGVSGNPLAASGELDGADPVPPRGVLAHATAGGPSRVTWQPQAGVRIAAVTVPWNGGTVLAGRSLREVERLEDQALLLTGAGWAATVSSLAAACLAVAWLRRDGGAPA